MTVQAVVISSVYHFVQYVTILQWVLFGAGVSGVHCEVDMDECELHTAECYNDALSSVWCWCVRCALWSGRGWVWTAHRRVLQWCSLCQPARHLLVQLLTGIYRRALWHCRLFTWPVSQQRYMQHWPCWKMVLWMPGILYRYSCHQHFATALLVFLMFLIPSVVKIPRRVWWWWWWWWWLLLLTRSHHRYQNLLSVMELVYLW